MHFLVWKSNDSSPTLWFEKQMKWFKPKLSTKGCSHGLTEQGLLSPTTRLHIAHLAPSPRLSSHHHLTKPTIIRKRRHKGQDWNQEFFPNKRKPSLETRQLWRHTLTHASVPALPAVSPALNRRIVWTGRDLKRPPDPTLSGWTGSPTARAGCFEFWEATLQRCGRYKAKRIAQD